MRKGVFELGIILMVLNYWQRPETIRIGIKLNKNLREQTFFERKSWREVKTIRRHFFDVRK